MKKALVESIESTFQCKEDRELLEILAFPNAAAWSEEAFEAARHVLATRGVLRTPEALEIVRGGRSPVHYYAARTLHPKPVRAASFVYWDLIERKDGTSAPWRLMFGLVGALIAEALRERDDYKFAAHTGILAAGAGHIHLLKFGIAPIAGENHINFTVPADIIESFLAQPPKKVIEFEPLEANAAGDKLEVSSAGNLLSQVRDTIGVNVISWGAFEGDPDATALAAMINGMLTHLAPESMIECVVSGKAASRAAAINDACADDRYMKKFFHHLARRKRDQQHEFLVAAWNVGGAMKKRIEGFLEEKTTLKWTRGALICFASCPLLWLGLVAVIPFQPEPGHGGEDIFRVLLFLLILPVAISTFLTLLALTAALFGKIFVSPWYSRELHALRSDAAAMTPDTSREL